MKVTYNETLISLVAENSAEAQLCNAIALLGLKPARAFVAEANVTLRLGDPEDAALLEIARPLYRMATRQPINVPRSLTEGVDYFSMKSTDVEALRKAAAQCAKRTIRPAKKNPPKTEGPDVPPGS